MEELKSNVLNNKVNISLLPTPIHKLETLSKSFSLNLYAKRDDLTGLALGGNKSRKLDYLIKDAILNKAKAVITFGSAQSNCCRQTAAACRLYNLECVLILEREEEKISSGNLLLDRILGAKIYFVDTTEEALQLYKKLSEEEYKENKLYFIPPGASNSIGVLGYVNAYKEILDDEKRLNINFDYIFFATSSLGTQTGLLLGKTIYGGNAKIYGISVAKNFFDITIKNEKQRIIDLALEFILKFNLNLKIESEDIIVDERFNLTGYGVLSEEEIDCIKLFSKNEAILLDPVYTARAATGMIRMIKNNEIIKGSNILFLHTGGYPGIFQESFAAKF